MHTLLDNPFVVNPKSHLFSHLPGIELGDIKYLFYVVSQQVVQLILVPEQVAHGKSQARLGLSSLMLMSTMKLPLSVVMLKPSSFELSSGFVKLLTVIVICD